jgi:hypothetical protein
MDPLMTSSLFPSNPSTKASVAMAQLMGGSGGDFTSYFESLLNASRRNHLPSTDSRLALVAAQSKLQQQTTLFNIFSDKYSTKSMSFGLLGGWSDVTSLPAWTYDVQRVLGDSRIDSLFGLQRQMSAYTSNLLKGAGTGSFSSLF